MKLALFIVREGHGEADAVPNLVVRLQSHLGIVLPFIPRDGNWRKTLGWQHQVEAACREVAGSGRCEALLLTRDADITEKPDGDCPKTSAPEMADWVRELDLPFPASVVLFYKEYETLFLAGAEGMAGKEVRDSHGTVVETLSAELGAHPDPEYPRDAKGWVRDHILDGYKPTLYQASLTRLLDLGDLDVNGLSSYRRLASALTFLAANLGVAGAVYPPPVQVVIDA